MAQNQKVISIDDVINTDLNELTKTAVVAKSAKPRTSTRVIKGEEHLTPEERERRKRIRKVERERAKTRSAEKARKKEALEGFEYTDPKLMKRNGVENYGWDSEGLLTNERRIKADVKSILTFYLGKLPSISIVEDQINEVNNEADKYQAAGDVDNYEKSLIIISHLKDKLAEIRENVKQDSFNRKRHEDKTKAMYSDPEFIQMDADLKQAQAELNEISPSLVAKKLDQFRQTMRVSEALVNKINGIEYTEGDVLSIDDVMDNEVPVNPAHENLERLEADYDEYCMFIASKLDVTVDEVYNMTSSQVLTRFREEYKDELADLKSTIADKKLAIAKFKQSSKVNQHEGTDIVSLINEMYEFDDMDEKETAIAKNIMASAYYDYASTIAYNVCTRLNMLHEIDEARCGAYMELSEEIEKWFNQRQIVGGLISFGDAMGARIRKGAERSLLRLKSSTASGSTLANINHYDNLAINNFIKYNPDFKDLSKELILDIIATEESRVLKSDDLDDKKVTGVTGYLVNRVGREASETDLNATIGGEQDDVDYWSLHDNSSNELSAEDREEAKINMVSLAECIKKLLSYFKVSEKYDREGNQSLVENEDIQMFDEIDKIIFFAFFGFEFNMIQGDNNDSKSEYVMSDIAELIAAHEARTTGVPYDEVRRISVASISKRKDKIIEKLKVIVKYDFRIKKALEYLFQWTRFNKDSVMYISNAREEMTMKGSYELLNSVRQKYDNFDATFINGMTLDDIFTIDETNPLDSEIADLFRS